MCLQDFRCDILNDIEDVFQNSTFGVIMSWSGRVSILLVIGSGQVKENAPVDIPAFSKGEKITFPTLS